MAAQAERIRLAWSRKFVQINWLAKSVPHNSLPEELSPDWRRVVIHKERKGEAIN